MRFGGKRADDQAFLRFWEVSHIWAVAAQEVEYKWHEVDSIYDHAPNAALHDSLMAQEDGWFSTGRPTKGKVTLMAVEVVHDA